MQNAHRWDLSYTQNRELSWLKFNERVLMEAADKTVPLIERLRFASIFTSNLDEFFMVRVGSLFDLNMMAPDDVENKSGMTPAQQLDKVFDAVRPLIARRDEIYRELTAELAQRGVEEIAYDALTESQRSYVQDYYKENIRPILSPQIIDRNHPFPHLRNKELYAAALLASKGKELLGIVDVPGSVPAILMLPGSPTRFVRTEAVVAAHVKKIFKIYDVQESAVIAVTRNADISLDEEKFDEDNPDFLNYMAKLLRKRERLAPVRLEVQGDAPRLTRMLQSSLKLENKQVYTCACPLKLSYAYMLDSCPAELYYPPYQPVWPEYLDRSQPMRIQIQQRDVLLFYPYQSIQPFLDLLKQAASDPQVLSIKITIYRLARNSAIAKYLIEAAENGKEVTVMMELRARFDEQNNIDWAREMEEAGCRIIYGPENMKCHAKICLITRKEKNGLSYITQIGTGNYNEKTSTLYTDFCMMTADPAIAQDAVAFFQNILIGAHSSEYEKLMVAPNCMKSRLIRLIDDETAKGENGRIIIKANSITERELIDKLCEASCAGVKIDLIIRGICCLVPGISGKTENIKVTSIVGRFLEHSRIYCFGEGAERKCYLSSADIMTRNQTRRVEIACPVSSPEIRDILSQYLDRILADNLKARSLKSDGNYISVTAESGDALIDVQKWYMEHPLVQSATVVAKPSFKDRLRGAFGFRK
ncbi:MAG: polyphosphate kinase 1 [Clostridia bacterium]|nr:polyphosphate kinase 1 [Clostridia bacterium]